MRKSKVAILLIGALIAMLAKAAYAQPPMPDSTRMERHLAMLKTKLNLADSQTVQIRTILENEQKKAAADREKFKGDRKAMQEARAQHREDTDKQIMKVLNKDQKQEFEKMQKAIRQGRPGGERPHRGQRPGGSRNGQ